MSNSYPTVRDVKAYPTVKSGIPSAYVESVPDGSVEGQVPLWSTGAWVPTLLQITHITGLQGQLDDRLPVSHLNDYNHSLIGSAVQPGDLAAVATSGSYTDLLNKPLIPTVLTDLDTTVTGSELNADHAKLLGIEPGATGDQTGAEIKAAYEAQPDTNAFTDADVARLEASALKANVLELDNTDPYTPTLSYHPATYKYVTDSLTGYLLLAGRPGGQEINGSVSTEGRKRAYILKITNYTLQATDPELLFFNPAVTGQTLKLTAAPEDGECRTVSCPSTAAHDFLLSGNGNSLFNSLSSFRVYPGEVWNLIFTTDLGWELYN